MRAPGKRCQKKTPYRRHVEFFRKNFKLAKSLKPPYYTFDSNMEHNCSFKQFKLDLIKNFFVTKELYLIFVSMKGIGNNYTLLLLLFPAYTLIFSKMSLSIIF
jgi:hypothetical protein